MALVLIVLATIYNFWNMNMKLTAP